MRTSEDVSGSCELRFRRSLPNSTREGGGLELAQMTGLRPSVLASVEPDGDPTPRRWFASMLAAFGLLAVAVARDAVVGRFARRRPPGPR